DPMGIQPITEMGKQLGKVVDEILDGTLLWSYAILRRLFLQLNSFYIRQIISIHKPCATNLHQNYNKKIK
ncbi:MAG: hypothetical protein IKA00_12585, partial [Prevotella sp.]|nr:hypothetical protein [Prevotella sp.]